MMLKSRLLKAKKIISLIVATGLMLSLSSCGGNEIVGSSGSEITYWVALDGNTSKTTTNLGETVFAKKLMEATDTKISYQHPSQAGAEEKFNLMIASGQLPDIVEFNWVRSYQGGPAKALADGIIQEIDIKNEAPNLYAYLQENPDIDKMCKTDDGKYFGFPFIRGDEYLLTSSGIYVREDLLKEIGEEMPETFDEWETVLEKMKGKVSGAPLNAAVAEAVAYFAQAFGTTNDLFVDNGVIKYGPMEDGYKEALKIMSDWCAKGYFPKDFSSVEAKDADILNDVHAFGVGACGSGIGRLMASAPNDTFSLVGVKNPVVNKGDKPMYGNYSNPVTGTFACITKNAKNKEQCLKLLDYGYSEEGCMLFNFGIENESYTMVDGYPTFTEDITSNKEGLSMAVAMAKYTRSHAEGAFIQDKRYMEQYAQLPQQKQSLENWMHSDASKYAMPPVVLTIEQQTELASSIDAIKTYVDEMTTKFIMGTEPIEKFDEFRNELKKRNVEKYIQYTQEAYERYMSR